MDIITLFTALLLVAAGLFLMIPGRTSRSRKATAPKDISSVIRVRDASLKEYDPARELRESIAPVTSEEADWERRYSSDSDQWSDREPVVTEEPEAEPVQENPAASPSEEGENVVGKKADENSTAPAPPDDPEEAPLELFDDF